MVRGFLLGLLSKAQAMTPSWQIPPSRPLGMLQRAKIHPTDFCAEFVQR
jgi:hypothetical protein